MIGSDRVLAIIPSRSGSKGLTDKNIRPLENKPLLAWPIEAACSSRYVDYVLLSTDSEAYAEIGRKFGASVPFLRPDDLATDTSPSADFICHALEYLDDKEAAFDYIVLLEPTSPLTTAQDVDDALETLVNNKNSADAAVGISETVSQHPAFAVKKSNNNKIEPFLGETFATLPRRQDIEPVFALDGSIYISTVEAYLETRTFCHERTLGIVSKRHQIFEVDDEIDFVCIEAVLRHLNRPKSKGEMN
ncbi:cytidylyltransferase domain-containing protein [Maritalea sp. S77]|uniref:acylneuraminate cytidylyltransferase family protein n=1 Tax=Maritalea sp. S77 TaxID=3415125 RepID=UPI003C7E59A6